MDNQKVPGGNELLNPEKILKNELKIVSGSYVGDFGCGSAGYFTFQSAKIVGDSGLIYAVDVLKTVLDSIRSRAAQTRVLNIRTIWSDLEKFGACKINDSSLDFGLVINVLFQAKNKKEILKESARMVKPGGKLLVVDWKPGRFPLGPRVQDKISPEDLLGMASDLGLQLERRFEAGQYHFGVIFIK